MADNDDGAVLHHPRSQSDDSPSKPTTPLTKQQQKKLDKERAKQAKYEAKERKKAEKINEKLNKWEARQRAASSASAYSRASTPDRTSVEVAPNPENEPREKAFSLSGLREGLRTPPGGSPLTPRRGKEKETTGKQKEVKTPPKTQATTNPTESSSDVSPQADQQHNPRSPKLNIVPPSMVNGSLSSFLNQQLGQKPTGKKLVLPPKGAYG
eukprot:m.88855 g.88855  ORF g.88855 m.88855 type:complete len:211 (-) comp13193_c0_seq1:5128-5760(-)